MKKSLLLFFLVAVSAGASEFVPLFDGRTLAGWTAVNGPADTFSVGDGMIVARGATRAFLVTERSFENFELELEWRHLQGGGNSGVLVWSEQLPATGAPYPRSIEVQVMDPGYEKGRPGADRNFTGHGDIFAIRGATITPAGRVADTGRKALPTARRTLPSPEWNHYRIVCRDGNVRLFVNGQQVTEAHGAAPRSGAIALQSEIGEVNFRNLRIRELPGKEKPLPPGKPFVRLFDGVSFAGWKAGPEIEKVWHINDGVVASRAGVPGKALHLWSEKSYRDIELIVDWRCPQKPAMRSRATFTPDGLYRFDADGKQIRQDILDAGDSGIFLRGDGLYQVNIWSQPMGSGDINELHKDSKISEELRRAMLPLVAADAPFGEWNRFRIVLKGDRVSVWLNARLVIDHAVMPGVPPEGPIALQYHRDEMEFTNIYLRELSDDEAGDAARAH